MFTKKSLLFVIFFITVFSASLYAGSLSCNCNVSGLGTDTKWDACDLPSGVVIHWTLSIGSYNTSSTTSTYTEAEVTTTGSNDDLFYTNSGLNHSYGPVTRTGERVVHELDAVMVWCTVQAGTGGGAGFASSSVSW
jgi:hypothetical protein